MKCLYRLILLMMMSLPFHVSAQDLQPAESNAPEQFEAFIGGFLGGSYKVTLEDGYVVYRFAPTMGSLADAKPLFIRPTHEQWQMFYQALDENKVWHWQEDYGSQGHDGTMWNVKLRTKDKTLSSRGHNLYPPTIEFNAFLKAISDLTGQKFL